MPALASTIFNTFQMIGIFGYFKVILSLKYLYPCHNVILQTLFTLLICLTAALINAKLTDTFKAGYIYLSFAVVYKLYISIHAMSVCLYN